MQFWEFYAGDAVLATHMEASALGFQVRTFDLLSGWDFTKPSHQIMHTFMHTHYWPPTETAYPAEHDAAQPAEHELALQPQQALAEQQPRVYDDEQLDINRGILTRLQETQWSAAQRTVQRIHRNLGHPNQP